MRKEESDFGWDWGPSFSPAGPWKPAYIVQMGKSNPVYVTNTAIDIFRKGQMPNLSPDQSQPFVFNASIDFIGTLPQGAEMHLQLVDSAGKTVKDAKLGDISQSNGTITGSVVIDEQVDLWWPSGYGAQNLYMATVSIVSSSIAKPVAVTKRVGFRTIVLNLNPITDEDKAKGVAPERAGSSRSTATSCTPRGPTSSRRTSSGRASTRPRSARSSSSPWPRTRTCCVSGPPEPTSPIGPTTWRTRWGSSSGRSSSSPWRTSPPFPT